MNRRLQPIATEVVEALEVRIYRDRQQLGAAAGQEVGAKMRALLGQQAQIRVIFAAAPSQNEFLQTLSHEREIDWSRVSVFHMDEYLGLAPDASQRFGRFLSDRLFNSVKPGQVYLIDSANTVDAEIRRYSALLAAAPIDIVCLGIGENGHIAFNDPGAAVRHALRGPITTACPASILRLHPSCILFLDRDSSDLS